MKLQGERRIITALFTDIEGFTAMTERLQPEALIDVLDAYFADVSAIVIRHGGMIDKIVGDAVHAFFNAPFDLDDHPAKALDCAFEIVAFTEVFRTRPEIASHALGRTRIGIETGPVVLGDVGRGSKLDYTAHGSAVNTAARLEALNARFSTAICSGPNAGPWRPVIASEAWASRRFAVAAASRSSSRCRGLPLLSGRDPCAVGMVHHMGRRRAR